MKKKLIPEGDCGKKLAKVLDKNHHNLWNGSYKCPDKKKCPFAKNPDAISKCLRRIDSIEDYKAQMRYNQKIAKKLTMEEFEQSFEGYTKCTNIHGKKYWLKKEKEGDK